MKKLLFILITFISLSAFSQGTQVLPDTKKVYATLDTVDVGTLVIKHDSISVDSLKEVISENGLNISKDSVMVLSEDGVVVISKDNLHKPTGKGLWEWFTYVIFLIGILIVIIISSLNFIRNSKIIQNSKNVFVQRIFAETSSFMKKAQIFSGTIAALGTSALSLQGQLDLFTPEMLGTIQTITIVSLAIAGGAIFTSKSSKHTV